VLKSAKQRVKLQQPDETEILLADDDTTAAEVNDDASDSGGDEDDAELESPAQTNIQQPQAIVPSVCTCNQPPRLC
jgi:hypothetical protein